MPVVAGQLRYYCGGHSPGDGAHPAEAATQRSPVTHLTGLMWLHHLKLYVFGDSHPLGAKTSVIKLENKPHVVELL